MQLLNYLCGEWVAGKGPGTLLYNPVTGAEIARAGSEGLDLAAALQFGRERGGPALRALSYAERANRLHAIADALSAQRDKYYQIALENSGNTKTDAALDIDGGIGTLKYYAGLGKQLGEARYLAEPGLERLARDEAFQGAHILTPIQGIAVHINAFNFPSWGLWEKAAVALLSGVPVFAKPATATALLSYEMVRDVIAADILPAGALSLICGGGRELMDLVTAQDAVAFTGSADTAASLRAHPNVIRSNVRFNVEADSLNSALLGPDAAPDSPEFQLFIKEVVREMSVKAGQKCTAIRRILVPAALQSKVEEALREGLAGVAVGDPRNERVRMGPLVTRSQQQAAWEGIERLKTEAAVVCGGERAFELVDADPARGYFVPPTLLRCADPSSSRVVHEVEVFGPVATVMPYADAEQAFALAARGGGSLVTSVFTGDGDFAIRAAVAIAPTHGRVLVVDKSIGGSHTGHGVVMPHCIHGGPGRAGGGEELGGLRALRFYHQRSAIQASAGCLKRLQETATVLVS